VVWRWKEVTVLAEHYWDYINEAWGEPNFSKTPFGPDPVLLVVPVLNHEYHCGS
jgi:hypothetical protein